MYGFSFRFSVNFEYFILHQIDHGKDHDGVTKNNNLTFDDGPVEELRIMDVRMERCTKKGMKRHFSCGEMV